MRSVGIVGPLGVKVGVGAIVAVSVATGVGAISGAQEVRRNKKNRKTLNNFNLFPPWQFIIDELIVIVIS